MAVFLSNNGVQVTVNSVALSDHVTSVTLNRTLSMNSKLQQWATQRPQVR
jgi:hypothetical protein